MKMFKFFLGAVFVGFGLANIWDGVVEFDKATTAIPLLRGAFWMVVGLMCLWNGVNLTRKNWK